MTPGYTFSIDPRHDMVVIRLAGFFGDADVDSFTAEREAAYQQLRCAPNHHLTLVDVTDCKIQSQAVVEAFAATMTNPDWQSRRLAFVTGGSLARMQVRRLIERRPNARCFEDRACAEAWLTASDEEAPPAD